MNNNTVISSGLSSVLQKHPLDRTQKELHMICYFLKRLDELAYYKMNDLLELGLHCRYLVLDSGFLYTKGTNIDSWFILLSGSVFIDGAMLLPGCSFGKSTSRMSCRPNTCEVLQPSEFIQIDYSETELVSALDSMSVDSSGSRSSFDSSRSHVRRTSDTSSAYWSGDVQISPEEIEIEVTDQWLDDAVKAILDKPNQKRSDSDLECLLKFMQSLTAFKCLPIATQNSLCPELKLHTLDKLDEIVETDNHWNILFSGMVAIINSRGELLEELLPGVGFGVGGYLEQAYKDTTFRTLTNTVQLFTVSKEAYFKALQVGERRAEQVHDSDGTLIMEVESQLTESGQRSGYIMLRAKPDKLIDHLIVHDSHLDPNYAVDFLMTYPVFLQSPVDLCQKLFRWLTDPELRDRVLMIVLLWVNTYFDHFEVDGDLKIFLANFTQYLVNHRESGPLKLLRLACQTKAEQRVISVNGNSNLTIRHMESGLYVMQDFPKLLIFSGDKVTNVDDFSVDSSNCEELLKKICQGRCGSMVVQYQPLAFCTYSSKPISSGSDGSSPLEVIKVYRYDHSWRFIPVDKSTKMIQVIDLAIRDFAITQPANHFCVTEVSIVAGTSVKTKRLPNSLSDLVRHLPHGARYYLKHLTMDQLNFTDEQTHELIEAHNCPFLSLSAEEVSQQLCQRNFKLLHAIRPSDLVDSVLFENTVNPRVNALEKTVDWDRTWVMHEVCNEYTLQDRVKIVKRFIRIASLCKKHRNFNSCLSIMMGLDHAFVQKLDETWNRVGKGMRECDELLELLNPNRNFYAYRCAVSATNAIPLIPFYPIVSKDLAAIHLINKTRINGLVNFEKMRMFSREVRALRTYTDQQYLFKRDEDTGSNTLKRRLAPAMTFFKKAYEKSAMVKRVDHYLKNLPAFDEKILERHSQQIHRIETGEAPEPSVPIKTADLGPKFGEKSTENVLKMLTLQEKVRKSTTSLLPSKPKPNIPPVKTSPISLRKRFEKKFAPKKLRLSEESSSVSSLTNLERSNMPHHHLTMPKSHSSATINRLPPSPLARQNPPPYSEAITRVQRHPPSYKVASHLGQLARQRYTAHRTASSRKVREEVIDYGDSSDVDDDELVTTV